MCVAIISYHVVSNYLTFSRTIFLLLYYVYSDHRDLHSFPTRRSSDLGTAADRAGNVSRCSTTSVTYVHDGLPPEPPSLSGDRKSTRLNSSHLGISYAVFCLKKKI